MNLDISAEDLRQRLTEGKIYRQDKIEAALTNFFTDENLTTLRDLALREVASSVDRSREAIVRREENGGLAPPHVERRDRVPRSVGRPRSVALRICDQSCRPVRGRFAICLHPRATTRSRSPPPASNR